MIKHSNFKYILRTLWPIFLIMILEAACQRMPFPALTLVFFDQNSLLLPTDTSFAQRSLWYGICLSAPGLLSMISSPLLCAHSDRIGRRPILMLTLIGSMIAMLFAASAIIIGVLWIFILGFTIQGAFSRTNPIAQAMVGDQINADQMIIAMGMLQSSIALGAFIGPVIGGYAAPLFLSHINYATPFMLAFSLALIAFMVTRFCLTDTSQQHSSTPRLSFHQALSTSNIRLLLFLFFTQLSWSMYYQYLPPILKTYMHFNAHSIGWFTGCIAVWLTLTSLILLPILKNWLNISSIGILAIIVELLGLVLTYYSLREQYIGLIWASGILVAVGDMLIYCSAVALFATKPNKQHLGSMMGISFIIVSLAWSITGLSGNFLLTASTTTPILWAATALLMSLLFF